MYTFVEDIELALEAEPLDVQVELTDDGYAVRRVSANTCP